MKKNFDAVGTAQAADMLTRLRTRYAREIPISAQGTMLRAEQRLDAELRDFLISTGKVSEPAVARKAGFPEDEIARAIESGQMRSWRDK